MILAVSTVKDSLPRLRAWVDLNLRNGVDHVVVFVDDDDPEVLRGLGSIPHVSVIASSTWWQGRRPARLNVRQRINANAVRAAAAAAGIEWVLHIDADEVAVIDRAELRDVPAETRAIRLQPFEAVSRDDWPDDRVTHFKRLLDEGELTLLVALGALPRATNTAYFHGHVGGKVAMRPADDLWLGTHHVVDSERVKQPVLEAPWLRLLHYESYSAEEFVRKWSNLATSGGPVVTRGARATLASAVRCLVGLDIDESTRHRLMLELFRRHVRDDFVLLDSLGLLTAADPASGRHTPHPDEGAVSVVDGALRAFGGADKSGFEPGGDVTRARELIDGAARTQRRRWRRPRP